MASKSSFSQVRSGGLAVLLAAAICPAADDTVAFKFVPGQLQITIGGKDFATYVFSHPKVTRPFFMSVRTPSGIQATRNFPPVQGVDDVDHDTFHPGLWHSFGDISGRDYWRNKCKTEHELFPEAPQGGPGKGTFTVRNYYQDEQGNRKVLEVCKYTILARPGYTLLIQDSTFSSTEEDFHFGDQEEMGFGMRVNTRIAERYGGTMVNADGLKGANDGIRVAVVGFHGQGKGHIKGFHKPGAGSGIVALCDIDEKVLQGGDAEFKQRGERVATFVDFRKLMEDKNIDAVSIATPEHQHITVAAHAVLAGKDAYVEKPLSHTIAEGRWPTGRASNSPISKARSRSGRTPRQR